MFDFNENLMLDRITIINQELPPYNNKFSFYWRGYHLISKEHPAIYIEMKILYLRGEDVLENYANILNWIYYNPLNKRIVSLIHINPFKETILEFLRDLSKK